MSWDVLLMSVPPDITTTENLPNDFSSELGPLPQVLSTIAAILPDLNLANPEWGILEGDGFHMEFNIGQRDPVDTIMLHVRGGDGALRSIHRICEHTGWRALDTTTGDFINFAQDPTKGLRQWRTYRDRVVASLRAEGEEVMTDVKVEAVTVTPEALATAKPKRKKWWHFWK